MVVCGMAESSFKALRAYVDGGAEPDELADLSSGARVVLEGLRSLLADCAALRREI